MANSKKQKTANKFEDQKSTDNVTVCRKIAVNAATKQICILTIELKILQIVGRDWEAFIEH